MNNLDCYVSFWGSGAWIGFLFLAAIALILDAGANRRKFKRYDKMRRKQYLSRKR